VKDKFERLEELDREIGLLEDEYLRPYFSERREGMKREYECLKGEIRQKIGEAKRIVELGRKHNI
jgi:hypothetical protein